MTTLQIFGCILLTAIVAGWVILINAYREEKGNTGDEIIYTDETHFD